MQKREGRRDDRSLAEGTNRVGFEHARNEGQPRVARRERRHDLMPCSGTTFYLDSEPGSF